ncbi:GspH/FimT family pseudopilin [Brumicola blandensis]|uniref:Type II secretion system protein H n=1 Tax=Brumicola blandensis TaxID=3075611 RepID=A0AAW8R139_9ALTE|nr:GspH/FimT family pseudopilin [Alteromonas sp. W409]MDT0582972.1 GspH/FimT family pseudopilin [Alteromonas sp. W409]
MNLKTQKHSEHGTTLVEMMIVIGILAILSTVGVPSFVSILTKARMTAEVNELNALMRFARFKAIEQEGTVVLCPAEDYSTCSSNWDAPKIIFFDDNHNQYRDPDEVLLTSKSVSENGIRVSSRNKLIRFYESGVTASPASIKVCPENSEAKYARLLTISLQGKLSLSKDRDENGIHETNAGKELSCYL